MKPALVGTIMLLVMVSAIAAQPSFRLTPTDKSFEASFPGEPRLETNVSTLARFRVEIHAYTFETSAPKFVLSYAQLTPFLDDLKPKDAIDSAIGGTLDNVRGKMLGQKEMTVKGKPAKAVTISVGNDTVMDGRIVCIKPRGYQPLVLHKKGVIPPFQQQFSDSFSVPN